ncbi:MAG: succinate dehydrogenase/fumarate reductase iron-sulfur subunit [Myxococcales bacterium]|nr:succinate dehydrogenase/fumarate reductase iron-sulfur subunit [Myxococcales bacterium]MCB9670347.1 succinate dehydrogenase/fumarate reductase iron-sulfur subunit [Alphaproteobacteria bacterium]MCB9693398.1 succinate dehydrogenase/fumarate reductase iron-sulfur subunit [Alphaproteobacteria bacterium]
MKARVWRQDGPQSQGAFEEHEVTCVPEMSFLEMLDVLNERLVSEGKRAIAFEHDCREGICGSCGAMVNGQPHGPADRTTLCQLHMRSFKQGDVLTIEPWRAEAFPVIRDLVVDRSSFDRIIQAGGYISVRTGAAQDANQIPIGKIIADAAFDAATCIGCGACAAACPNASASLFTSAKLFHLNSVPQGEVERGQRTLAMVEQMDAEGFGHCTNHGECEAACPKGITINHIAAMNRDLIRATATGR